MNTLRARIALLLVVATAAVVALATIAVISVLTGPRPENTMEPVARMIHAIVETAQSGEDHSIQPGIVLSNTNHDGRINMELSGFLSEALRRTGDAREVVVTGDDDKDGALFASVRLSSAHWLILQIPQFKPPSGRRTILAMWISLILAGSLLVSVYAASMITRPLRLVQKAANSIGSDAVMDPIPERGPAEVQATAQALNRLSARLKTAMESRMRLVAAAGHDLRTPMTRMRLRAEFIADDEERAKWLADLAELDMIADSAIALVREEVGASENETVALDLLVTEIADEMLMLKPPVVLGALEPVAVKGSRAALKRALRNLIDNAATHGGGARVDVACKDDSGVVSITDNGPGIPENQITHVFEPFFRVDISRRKTVPGAGLGMAIAREIIQRYRGTIVVENRTEGGLRQVISLPATGQETETTPRTDKGTLSS